MITRKQLKQNLADEKYQTTLAKNELAWNKKYEKDYLASVAEMTTVLDAVLDVLGLREAYPDVTEEFEDTRIVYPYSYSYSYSYSYKLQTFTNKRTVYGRDSFKADLLKAANATKGTKALARIQAALKKGKKNG